MINRRSRETAEHRCKILTGSAKYEIAGEAGIVVSNRGLQILCYIKGLFLGKNISARQFM